MSDAAPVVLLVVLLLVFWLVVVRPARRSQSATTELQRNLEVGDDVVLSAGIFGTITELGESRVRLEIAPGTVVTVARQVVVRRVEDLPDEQPGATAPLDEHDDDRPAAGQEK